MRLLFLSWRLFKMSMQRSMAYRVDFLFRVVRSFVDTAMSVVMVRLLFGEVSAIRGWSIYEALLVYALFQWVWAIVYTFVGGGIKRLHENILYGDLDYCLTKPVDSQFYVSFQLSYITSFIRILLSGILIMYALMHIQFHSITSITLGIASLTSGVIIYYCLTFLSATTAFWTGMGSLQEITEHLATVARFPIFLYDKTLIVIFSIFPLIFIATVPALAFTQKNFILPVLSPLVAGGVFVLTRWVWQRGLQSYSSASS